MNLSPSRILEGVIVGLLVAAIGAVLLKAYRETHS